MKVISLIGARPQFIKEAVLHKEFNKNGVDEIIVNSGQHYDYNMADVFFKTLNIRTPDYNLKVGSGKHGWMTGTIMIRFEKIVEDVQPDIILVYGDTNTTLAGAIVGAKLNIPVGHVEAGIRMKPKNMPEEINRVLTDRISTLLFCSSKGAIANLNKEGITERVYFTGDVMYDLFLTMKNQFKYDKFEDLKLNENEYILTTLHRNYNVDNKGKLRKILQALQRISTKTKIVFPMHPRTKKNIENFGLKDLLKDIIVIEPIDYLNLMGLITLSKKVITDSGGIQKEAYWAKKQAILLMPYPAWTELVDQKFNILADSQNLTKQVLCKPRSYNNCNIYGDGNAGEKITDILSNFIKKR